jgi:proteasome lid subunit RPN8/RPN11
MKLVVKRRVFEEIAKRCIEGYPYETAGLMFGDLGSRLVLDIYPVQNIHEHDRRVRYRIDPMEYYRAEKTAEEKGMTIVGVYHSHPNVAARPSAYDLEYALPPWSYLILSVNHEKVLEYASWRAVQNNGEKKFLQEEVVVE